MAFKSQNTLSIVFVTVLIVAITHAAVTLDPAKENLNTEAKSADTKSTEAKQVEKKVDEPWTPVTEPREFEINVADGIHGAHQIRHEKWDKGTATGMFSRHVGDKKWEIVSYVADAGGFRITSTKLVDESELAGIKQSLETNKAKVNINRDGTKTTYTLVPGETPGTQKDINNQANKQK